MPFSGELQKKFPLGGGQKSVKTVLAVLEIASTNVHYENLRKL